MLAAGAFALYLVVAGGGGGLSGALEEGDQALIQQELSGKGGSGGRAQRVAGDEGGGGDLAAAVLGAYDPGRAGFAEARGLYSLQPGETRVSATGSRLAVVEFSPLR